MKILRSPANSLICLLLLVFGLVPYVSLFLKSDPIFSYSGVVTSVGEFIAYFSREAYQGVDQTANADLLDKIQFVGWLAGQSLLQFGYGFALLALVGLARGLAVARLVNAGILVIFLGNTVVLTFLLGFEFDFIHQAVFKPYPLVAWVCMSLWIGSALQWVSDRPFGKVMPVLIVTVLGFAMSLENWWSNDRSGDRLAHNYAGFLLRSLEPSSNLIVTSDPQVGPLSYLNQVVGLRPDVTLYEAENLFFSDKIPGETIAEKKSFVQNLSPVFSVGIPWLPDGQDFGLYLKHGPGLSGYELIPGIEDFVSSLVHDYRLGKFRDPNTLYFSHQLLIALGNQLTHYVFTKRVEPKTSEMFQSVMQTFPGMLAILSTLIANPHYPMPDDVLVEVVLAFDDSFGVETPDHEIAAYYYYIALLLANPDATLEKNEELALHYLQKGLAIMPGKDNPGLKLLDELSSSS
ncbi:MAG: hypothetical protein IIA75_07480 [Proteobacteria bacterium]|nr:hypothetical protein [Pseudomonadota bacterium]